MIADMQAEIERLQARVADLQHDLAITNESNTAGIAMDGRRAVLLRDIAAGPHVDADCCGWELWHREMRARIRAELGDEPRHTTPAKAIYGSESGR